MKKKAKTSKAKLPPPFYLGNTVEAGEVIEAIAEQAGKRDVFIHKLAHLDPCELEDAFNEEFQDISISYQGDLKFTVVK